MSYGLKYYAEFKDYYNRDVTVNIYGRDFSGVAVEVKLAAGEEAIVDYPGDDRNLYHAIFGSQAKVKMISETDFQFIDLHTSDSRGHRLDILLDGVLDWRGWILPDLFNEPYVAPPYPVEITARCGLGELKERQLPEQMTRLLMTSELVIDVNTFVSLYDIIGNAILGIETDLKLNEVIGLHHDSGATINDSALYDTFVDLSMYEGLTYYDALEDILKAFGARLYQLGGEWWFVRVDELKDTLKVRTWTISRPINNSFTTSEEKKTTFLIGKQLYSDSQGGLIVNDSPSLDILPAWKEFTIVNKLGRKESLLKNNLFSEWTNDYSGIEGRTRISFNLKEWEQPFDNYAERKIDSDGNSFVQLPPTSGFALRQEVENLNISPYLQRLKFKIQFDILSYNTDFKTGRFGFIIKTEGYPFNYYLVVDEDEPTGFKWQTGTAQIIEVEDIETSFYGGRYNRSGNVSFDWKTFEFAAPGIQTEGSLIVEIYPAYRDVWTNVTSQDQLRLRLNEFSCSIVDANEIPFVEQTEINTLINENNIYIPEQVEIIGGDVPDIPNNVHIWKNYFADETGKPTVSWGGLPLLQVLANDYKKRANKPQFKLTVPILSSKVQFDSTIVDYLIPQVKDKKYICCSASKNYQTCIFRGDFVEFADFEGNFWILADGFWNDTGVWIDSETWKDDAANLIEITVSGVGDHDITANFTTGDTILSLLNDGLTQGAYLKEYGVEITTVPYLYNGGPLVFNSGFTEIYASFSLYFDAIVGGVAKTIKINVNV